MTAIPTAPPEVPPLAVVPAERDMSDEIFIRHLNKRHANALDGLRRLPLRHITPYILQCYRAYHRHLHGILAMYYPKLDHDHADLP